MTVTCLLGDPVDHSVSNHLFALYSRQFGLEYSHVKLRVDSSNKQNIAKAIDGLRAMNFAGANITLPFKLDVIPLIDEVDKSAKFMGAVNTIVNKDGYLIGYNTDSYGAIKTIEIELRPIQKEDKVLILGAGGAARAVLYEVLKKTDKVSVLNRSPERLAKLREDFQKVGLQFNADILNQENFLRIGREADFIINATSVGMSPNVSSALFEENLIKDLGDKKYFFDVIFNPAETKFIKDAKTHGHVTIGGMKMMIYQGIKAFELWTGKQVSEDVVEEANKLLVSLLHD